MEIQLECGRERGRKWKEGGVILEELLFAHKGLTGCSDLSKWFTVTMTDSKVQPSVITPNTKQRKLIGQRAKRWGVIYEPLFTPHSHHPLFVIHNKVPHQHTLAMTCFFSTPIKAKVKITSLMVKLHAGETKGINISARKQGGKGCADMWASDSTLFSFFNLMLYCAATENIFQKAVWNWLYLYHFWWKTRWMCICGVVFIVFIVAHRFSCTSQHVWVDESW